MTCCPYMHLKMESSLAALSGATKAIEAFLDGLNLGSKERYVVALAFEEMASNIIKYGYDRAAAAAPVDVYLSSDGSAVKLVLEDSGHEFNPLKIEEPELFDPVENREIGGLGVHLVRRMADSLEYKRSNGKNQLTITVKLRHDDAQEVQK